MTRPAGTSDLNDALERTAPSSIAPRSGDAATAARNSVIELARARGHPAHRQVRCERESGERVSSTGGAEAAHRRLGDVGSDFVQAKRSERSGLHLYHRRPAEAPVVRPPALRPMRR